MKYFTVARQQTAMHQLMELWLKTMSDKPAPSHLRRQGPLARLVVGLSLSVVLAILSGKYLPAQIQVSQATKPAQHQKADVNPAETPRATPEVMAVRPPASQASVSWNNGGLEIEASNSSLNQILHQVAVDTGAKLEGLTQDQRVFGRYGPGPVSDVLWKLLDGSGYNVLMIGGTGTDTALEIVLSARPPASPQAVNNQNRSNSAHDEPEPQPNYPPEPSRPQPIQDPFSNGGPPRDPLQSMQEILQRQQKIDEQQQQNNPPQ